MTGLAPPWMLALAAVATGSVLALIASSFTSNLNPRSLARRVKQGQIPLHKAAIVGLGSFVVYPLLYFTAIQSGPAVLVNLVNYLWPIFAIAIFAAFRRAQRSLELTLSGAFGLAGAGLAITAGDVSVSGQLEAKPFIAAGAGALVYGSVTAYTNLRARGPSDEPLGFLLVSLLCGGIACIALILAVAIFNPGSFDIGLTPARVATFLAYATLLPCAHLSWLFAVARATVPSFASAFVVPVLATALLAVVTRGYAGPQILASLTLVLCAIALSVPYRHGVPVAFAITLSALASVLISQTFPQGITAGLDLTANGYQQPLVSLLAILSGFVLSNAIRRYDKLQDFLLAFFVKAHAVLGNNVDEFRKEVNVLGRLIIDSTRVPGYQIEPSARSTGSAYLIDQWAAVKGALENRISRYEWFVLLLNSASVIFVLHVSSIRSTQLVTLVVRAAATGVVVGVLFAVRDYDLNRPERLPRVFRTLCSQYGLTEVQGVTQPSFIEGTSYSRVTLTGLLFLSALAGAAITWNALAMH